MIWVFELERCKIICLCVRGCARGLIGWDLGFDFDLAKP